MKKLYLLFFLLFLSACTSSWIKLSFDSFSIRIDSWLEYQDISQELNSPIIQAYKTEWSWSQSSILVAKYPNDGESLEEMFVYNTKNIQPLYQSSQEFIFPCQGTDISNILYEFATEKDWKILYFVQDFYIHDNDSYIISFSSNIKSEINMFIDWLKQIKCK